ncbi:BQ2448_2518 [Microbotryum intermedium]|uniref:BQ2448_2518 protein n=1 Tax=Microbotryum intermedium TaxID=269621 RepID=A0A238FEE1_9BASI|nr:BQ2448_2518 [Microbotryum intermedium]
MSSPHEPGPIEASIHEKLTRSLSPSHLSISNDSASHSHHSAMRAIGGGSGETHFTVEIRAIQRHRLVNESLKEEFEVKGLHALAIKAKSPSEVAGKP